MFFIVWKIDICLGIMEVDVGRYFCSSFFYGLTFVQVLFLVIKIIENYGGRLR
jgi:hypothetical protein